MPQKASRFGFAAGVAATLFTVSLFASPSLAQINDVGTEKADPSTIASISSPIPRSRGNSFNPEISATGLILYRGSNQGELATSPEPNGLGLQELELQFAADVDPYSRFYALLAMSSEITFNASTGRNETEFVFEPEEVFAESTIVPSTIVRIGLIDALIGKHNLLHLHAFPFIDAPLAQAGVLGSEESWTDVGVSASLLLPLPWFSEISAQALNGEAEAVTLYNSRTQGDIVGIAHLENLWDLNESSTFEFGLSGATGENDLGGRTEISGVDLTYKWRPTEGGKYKALVISVEALQRNQKETGGIGNEVRGLSAWVQHQFARRWWAQARSEWLDQEPNGAFTSTPVPTTQKWSALIGFVPSEFSLFRVQYDDIHREGQEDEKRVLAQLNFAIGAHPAHSY